MELDLRFNEIKNDIRRASLPAKIRKLSLTAEMEKEVLEFFEIMEVYHTVSLFGEECIMSGTRTLFDALIKRYPLLKDDITTNSRHVHNPDFENGIVKIQPDESRRG
jgi:hypothetical protein